MLGFNIITVMNFTREEMNWKPKKIQIWKGIWVYELCNISAVLCQSPSSHLIIRMGWNSVLCKRLQSVWLYGNSSGNMWSARLWLPKTSTILSVRATKWKPGFMVWGMAVCMDIVSLYVLYSCFTPCDATLGNCFFQMLSYAHAHACIMKRRKDNSHENITGFEMGKQNIQSKGLHCI